MVEAVVVLSVEEEMEEEEEEGEGFRDLGVLEGRVVSNNRPKVDFRIRVVIREGQVPADINNNNNSSRSSSRVADMVDRHREVLWEAEAIKEEIEVVWVEVAIKGFNHPLKGDRIRDQEGRLTVVIMVTVGHTKI